ncbi:MAG: protein translocase subunit SecD [Planctomycetota bacterium]|jgi:SecD/SecF fusion protein
MRNLIWKIVAILALLALCLWSVYPPQDRVRLGKDLRGGVSLVYQVKINPDDPDPQGTLGKVIEVLKDRVDPRGILDIAMQPVGIDRIEIVMPLPTAEVVALRRAYEDTLDRLMREAHISVGDLQTALEAGQAVERFGGEPGPRQDLIDRLQRGYDEVQTALDGLEQAQEAGAGADVLRPLEQAAADAEITFEDLRDEALALSLARAQVERTVRLSTDPVKRVDEQGNKIIDEATGQQALGPSLRATAIGSLSTDFPHLAGHVEALVAAYDAYAAQRKGLDDPEDLMRLLRGAGVLDFRIAVRNSDPQDVNVVDMREQLTERGPRDTDSLVARWFPINDLKQWYSEPEQLEALRANPVAYFGSGGQDLVAAERDGQYYLLLYTTAARSMVHGAGAEWTVTGTYPTIDNFGRTAVGVTLDAPGGREMTRLTGPHQREPMAIVLDGEVYSAPRINDVLSTTFVIMGSFSQAELNYLHRVLDAGSLQARLTPDPIAMNTLGPSIGRDNLHRGVEAFLIALVAVAVFMMAYYFFAGMVADFALVVNGVIIFGVMAMIDGTFTLPGLAGIVLTIGMAVDANVLIYERVREELFGGEVDLRGAIRLGYRKALSTIIDANVTNLLVCLILLRTATTEVKGFALILLIGICATLFTALFVTRVIYEVYTDVVKLARLPMLPTVFPLIHRVLEPDINWIGLRKYFWSVSIVVLAGSVALVSTRGADMFDTEFRGGVAVTMRTAVIDQDRDGQPDEVGETGAPVRLLLPHTGPDGVETRLRALAEVLGPGPASGERQAARDRLLSALQVAGVIEGPSDERLATVRSILDEVANATVLTVGDTEVRGGVQYGTSFQAKVASPKGLDEAQTTTDVVVTAIVSEFGDELDVTRPLSFRGSGSEDYAEFTHPITKDILGQNIDRPRALDKVTDFRRGVAVVIDEIDPPVTVREVAKRVSRMRGQPDFAPYVGRDVRVIGLEVADSADPGLGYTSVAVLVYDPALADADQEIWEQQLAQAEWGLISQALQRRTSLEQVSSFSSAVARTLADNAIVAVGLSLLGILVYIWVRFGSLRYSAAAIAALVHDVTIALGLLALTAWVGGTPVASALLIEEFRIDLGVVAALLTIIGYSLNDTIVILDRIRENRGKLPIPTRDIVNRSINQTISRTVLTSFTTLLAVGIMYAAGGSGIRPFAFCLLTGLLVGTYSSVAIAAPLVVRGGAPEPAMD